MAKSKPASAAQTWSYKADIVTPCNCDWGCPCTFNQPPTYGFCQGAWILNVREGRANGLDISGLKFAWVGSWPRALHFGGGTAKLILDSGASAAQKQAIESIAQGRFGGRPWPVLSKTIDHWLPSVSAAFEWKSDGAHSAVKAGDQLQVVLEPMRNPVTGLETEAKIILTSGILTVEENVTTTQSFSVFMEGLKYAWPQRNAWYGSVQHGT